MMAALRRQYRRHSRDEVMNGNAALQRLVRRQTTTPERGQSLVEFTLMMSIIMILMLGMLDLGRAFFTFLAMQDAAGEGASFAAVHPTWRTSANQADPNNITYRVRNSAPTGTLVDMNTATVTVTDDGSLITVTMTADFQLVTPFVGGIVGSQTLPLTVRSVAVITSAGP